MDYNNNMDKEKKPGVLYKNKWGKIIEQIINIVIISWLMFSGYLITKVVTENTLVSVCASISIGVMIYWILEA